LGLECTTQKRQCHIRFFSGGAGEHKAEYRQFHIPKWQAWTDDASLDHEAGLPPVFATGEFSIEDGCIVGRHDGRRR
jgi:hypothetical protein